MAYIPKPRWTKRQEQVLVENYQKIIDEELSEILGKSLKSIRQKRLRMGLEKESGRPANTESENI